MKRTSFSSWPCSIARTMDLVGDAWTPLVLREAFYGIRRFDDFQQELGIARNTLADRLARLVAAGLLAKHAYETTPARYEYLLTESGRDFYGVLLAVTAWGDRWLSGESGPPITTHHDTCGHDTTAEVVCSHCGQPLAWDEVTPRPGPGYPPKLLSRTDIRRRFHLDPEPGQAAAADAADNPVAGARVR